MLDHMGAILAESTQERQRAVKRSAAQVQRTDSIAVEVAPVRELNQVHDGARSGGPERVSGQELLESQGGKREGRRTSQKSTL